MHTSTFPIMAKKHEISICYSWLALPRNPDAIKKDYAKTMKKQNKTKQKTKKQKNKTKRKPFSGLSQEIVTL